MKPKHLFTLAVPICSTHASTHASLTLAWRLPTLISTLAFDVGKIFVCRYTKAGSSLVRSRRHSTSVVLVAHCIINKGSPCRCVRAFSRSPLGEVVHVAKPENISKRALSTRVPPLQENYPLHLLQLRIALHMVLRDLLPYLSIWESRHAFLIQLLFLHVYKDSSPITKRYDFILVYMHI